MFVDKGKYFIIEEFEEKKIGTIFTDKTWGDVKEKLFLSKDKKKNQREFLKEFELEDRILVYGSQTHTNKVVDIKENDEIKFFLDTDGYITKRKDVVIFTQYADCLPVYLYSQEKQVIGLCHSGWQGSYKGIATEAINMMVKNYGCRVEEIEVALGIGVGQCCYEVGNEFYEKFKEKYDTSILKDCFIKKGNKWYYDNTLFNEKVLQSIGVEKILKSERCTYCEERFHSYRREGKESGRNGAFIYFKNS